MLHGVATLTLRQHEVTSSLDQMAEHLGGRLAWKWLEVSLEEKTVTGIVLTEA